MSALKERKVSVTKKEEVLRGTRSKLNALLKSTETSLKPIIIPKTFITKLLARFLKNDIHYSVEILIVKE